MARRWYSMLARSVVEPCDVTMAFRVRARVSYFVLFAIYQNPGTSLILDFETTCDGRQMA